MDAKRTRRDLLRGGAAALIGAAASPLLRAAPTERIARPATAKNVIVLWMTGGPSHVDTFDLKSASGGFAPIDTATDGLRICEGLPQLARRTRHLAIVRSMWSRIADHARAEELFHTGHLASGVVHPWFLAAVAAELAPDPPILPLSVVLGPPLAGAGYLDERYAPFVVLGTDMVARQLRLPQGVVQARQDARLELAGALDDRFEAEVGGGRLEAARRRAELAAELTRGNVAHAFDLSAEPADVRARYGDTAFGRRCALARRLVEHGVRFVEVPLAGWDTHMDNFDKTKSLLQVLDPAWSALLDDLEQRGLLDETLVLWAGEFGRTPHINFDFGRDHHWKCFSAVLAGGGVRGGQVIGASDATGHEPRDRPVSIPDLLATIVTALGVDPRTTQWTRSGRPVEIVEGGTPVAEALV